MSFFVLRAFFAFSLIFSSLPLSANPPLLEAMKAWESKEDKRAGILFAPLRKIPIARPYWNQLRREGIIKDLVEANKLDKSCLEVDLLDGDIRALKEDGIANDWFKASTIVRRNQKKHDVSVKLEKLNTPASLGLFADYCSPAPQESVALVRIGRRQADVTVTSKEDLINKCFLTGFLKNYFDARCFLHGGVKCEEPKLELPDGQISLFERILGKKDNVGDALFDFYRMQKVKPALTATNAMYVTIFCENLLTSAAYYGSVDAQKLLLEKQSLYWTMQLANQSDPVALMKIASNFNFGLGVTQDKEKAFRLSCLAVNTNSDNLANIYRNHAILLNDRGAQPSEIEKYLLLALKFDASFVNQENYGLFLAQQGRREEAKKYLLPPAKEGSFEALDKYVALCTDPDEYNHLLPICLEKADSNVEIAYLFIKMIAGSKQHVREGYKEPLKKLWKKLTSAKKKSKEEWRRQGGCLFKFNPDHILEGNALSFFEKGAALGSHTARFMVGWFYEEGIGGATSIDRSKALKAYEWIIEKGKTAPPDILANAYLDAGKMLMNGNNSKAYKKAIHYLKKAQEWEEFKMVSTYNLGLMYMRGKGTKVDIPLAKKCFLDVKDYELCKIDARYFLALIEYKEDSNFSKIYELLAEGIDSENPDTLNLMAQMIICDPATVNNKDKLREALHYLKKSIHLGAPRAKALYLYYGTLGIDGMIRKEKDPKVIKRIFNSLSEEDKEAYLTILGQTLPSMTKLFTEEEQEVPEPLPEEAPQEISEEEIGTCLLNDEEEPQPEREETGVDRKFQKLQEEFNNLVGKKKVKWTKLRPLIGQAIELTSGHIKPGKGSGTQIKVGDTKTGLHLPHGKGKDSTEIKGGRLKSVIGLLEGCLEESPSKKDLSKNSNNDPE